MEEGNIAVLVDAKTEYTKQLINILKTSIYQGIQSIYGESKFVCEDTNLPDDVLIKFQQSLSNIPKWSQDIIDKEYERIMKSSKCDWIEDLITAVFVSHTKVLTMIHKGKRGKKINLKIPKSSHFIHLCYIEVAREIWKSPYLFSEKVSKFDFQRNIRDSENIISDAIAETIRNQLPVKHILKEYLGDNYQSEAEEEDDKTENITQPTSKKHVKDIKKMVTKQINETSSNLNIENDNDLKNLIKEEVSKQISGEEVKEGLIVEETVPVVEEVKEVAPEVEEVKEVTPEVEEVKEVTPEVEEVKEVKEDKEEVSPIVEEVKEDKEEVAPVVEEDKDDKDEVAPVVEEVKEDKEKVVPVIEEEVKEDKEEVVPVVEEEVEEDNELKELDLKKKPEEIVNSDDIKTLLLDNDINYDENIENEDSEEEDNSDDENDDSDEDSEDSNSYDSELDESDINDSDLEDSDYDEEENNNDKLEIEDIGDLDIELDDLDLNLDDNEVDLNELSETKQNEQVLNNKEAFSFYDE